MKNVLSSIVRSSIGVLACAVLAGPIVMAQDRFEVSALKSGGFQQVVDGVWERIGNDGVVERKGYGSASLSYFVHSLSQRADDLMRSASPDMSMFELLHVDNLLSTIMTSAQQVSSMAGGADLKASGDNGCAASFGSASASVSPVGASAVGSATRSLFGPPPPGVMRVVAAVVFKNSVVDLDVNAEYGGTLGSTISASATGSPSTAHCYMYAYGQYAVVGAGCANWADAMYSGTCN